MMRKVVIVDDSATARIFTRRCFEMAGLDAESVVECSDAREAVAHLDDPTLDLLITDLIMPHMSGKQLLAESQRRGNQFAIVVVSSAINQAETVELEKLGARIVLKKPISPRGASEVLAQLGAA
jgi:two-component system, chemotaxis family, chemotaxis protein CheY